MYTSGVLLSVHDFDRAFCNEAPKRFDVEPQRSTQLHGGKHPQPGHLVESVYRQTQIASRLPDVQEQLTDCSIVRQPGLSQKSRMPQFDLTYQTIGVA